MLLLLIFSVFHLVNSQVALPGNCPDAPPAQTFEKNDITGTWYTIDRYLNHLDEDLKCVKFDITLKSEDDYVVEYSGIKKMDNTPVRVTLPIVFVTDTSVGSLEDYVQGRISKLILLVLKLNTDYGVAWNCRENGTHFVGISWIFSRVKTLSPELRSEALAIYEEHNLAKEYLIEMDQSNCPE